MTSTPATASPATALHAPPLASYDWDRILDDLDAEGWALLPGLFPPALAQQLALPDGAAHTAALMDALRLALYPRLLPLARTWAAALQAGLAAAPPQAPRAAALPAAPRYPDDFAAWLQQNHAAGQTRNLSAVHRLRTGDYLPLTHHADGDVFPLQLVALLSAPDLDFTGGEFVMTEQRPRMQSRPMVLPLRQGDAAVIAVSHRPVQGARDVYRVTARLGVSRVRSGERAGLQVLLHNGR